MDLSTILSIIATIIAIVSYWKTSKYGRYDYAPRLDIRDDLVSFNSPSLLSDDRAVNEPGNEKALKKADWFTYKAVITNKAEKPLQILRVCMDYGSEDINKRYKLVVEGSFHLSSGESRQIETSISNVDMREAMRKFDIKHCLFWLRLEYKDLYGKKREISRSYGGYNGEGVTFMSRGGETLV